MAPSGDNLPAAPMEGELAEEDDEDAGAEATAHAEQVGGTRGDWGYAERRGCGAGGAPGRSSGDLHVNNRSSGGEAKSQQKPAETALWNRRGFNGSSGHDFGDSGFSNGREGRGNYPPRAPRQDERRRYDRQPLADEAPAELGHQDLSEAEKLVRLSHALGRTLRYHINEINLREDENGYVAVADLLQLPPFHQADESMIRAVVSTSLGSRGPRFELRERREEVDGGEETPRLEVRALYRHQQDNLALSRIGGGLRRSGFEGGGNRYQSRQSALEYRQSGGWSSPFAVGFSKLPAPEPAAETAEEEQAKDWASILGDQRGLRKQDGSRTAAAATTATTSARAGGGGGGGGRASAAAASLATTRGNSSDGPVGSVGVPGATATEETGDGRTGEKWEKYTEPGTGRTWFWNATTEEVLWADEAEELGWERFLDGEDKPWWWHEADQRFFYEVEEDVEDDEVAE